uniref:Uncharacterized protein n=1 Tax=Ananas comosus var. bracteatus TaxID=296719 RepID=A0A6V7NX89_ANACO|nr:unnamed protein product [Ananas comosus var. bracteatus]
MEKQRRGRWGGRSSARGGEVVVELGEVDGEVDAALGAGESGEAVGHVEDRPAPGAGELDLGRIDPLRPRRRRRRRSRRARARAGSRRRRRPRPRRRRRVPRRRRGLVHELGGSIWGSWHLGHMNSVIPGATARIPWHPAHRTLHPPAAAPVAPAPPSPESAAPPAEAARLLGTFWWVVDSVPTYGSSPENCGLKRCTKIQKVEFLVSSRVAFSRLCTGTGLVAVPAWSWERSLFERRSSTPLGLGLGFELLVRLDWKDSNSRLEIKKSFLRNRAFGTDGGTGSRQGDRLAS